LSYAHRISSAIRRGKSDIVKFSDTAERSEHILPSAAADAPTGRHNPKLHRSTSSPRGPVSIQRTCYTAVIKAYGFFAKKDLLKQLLDLNLDVAARIERGEEVIACGVR
jgi:hypothetical protein